MPKTFTAQNVVSVNPIQFVWKEGELVAIMVDCEVNYGEMGVSHQVDIFEDLTPEQKNRAKQVYQFIKGKVEKAFLE